MLDFVIAGVPASIIVVAIVEAIKRLAKIEGDAAIAVAIAVGFIVALAGHLASISPRFSEWWQVVVGGLLLGLSACGLFDLAQATKAKLQ